MMLICDYLSEVIGMPGIRGVGGEGSHHAGVLSPFAERARQCLQPEIKPRSSDESGRGRSARGAALFGWTVAGKVGKPVRQPCDQVRTPAAGSLQLLPP